MQGYQRQHAETQDGAINCALSKALAKTYDLSIASQNADPVTVDQEVGGSSPPSCTSGNLLHERALIGSLKLPNGAFQDFRWGLATAPATAGDPVCLSMPLLVPDCPQALSRRRAAIRISTQKTTN
jgi:hypothetical protein